jgi:hypothetical protein
MITKDLHNFTGIQRASRRAQPRHRGVLRLGAALRTRVADQGGQALAEFVLVLPLLLLLLFGILEFGLALNSESDETHLANEVARFAIINENPGGAEALQQWAKSQWDTNFLTGAGKICISFPEGEEAGKPVKVEATSTIHWIPVLKLKAVSTTLKGTAYMRLETAPSNYKPGCSQ